MQKAKEDENKLNLIKCPLPKIIYSTICGLPTFPKKPGVIASTNTYYSKKNSNQRRGLPSLKTNNKFISSPNKTNYINVKQANNLNNTSNNMINMNKTNDLKMNRVNKSSNNNNKEINIKTMKETLNNFGLNKYYDKMVELGINDQNYNSIGLMNKKSFNELVSNMRMFPGHIIKMEQLYHYLKQINFSNKPLHINSNPKINNQNFNVNSSYDNNNNSSNFNNNNVNYVTISFNRNNNNGINGKIIHSKSHYKYRFINPMIKQKNLNDNYNSEISKSKSKVIQHQPITNYSYHRTTKYKNRSNNNRVNNITKNNFEFPIPPMNPGRNVLIKYFFKDLANFTSNLSGFGNKINNKANMNNLYNNNTRNNSLLNNTKDLNHEINYNIKSNTYIDKIVSKNNMQENVQNDLPSINNITNNNNNRTLLNSIYRTLHKQASPQLGPRGEYIKKNRKNKNSKNNKNKNNSNDIIDKSKTINGYQRDYSINTFMNDEYEKNANNNNTGLKGFGMNKKQNNNLLYSNNKNIQQKTAYEIMNKNNRLNNGLKLKLPNVMNKTDFQNSLEKSKIKNKIGNEQNNINIVDKKENKNVDINANTNLNIDIKQYNNNIVLKNEKTLLKRTNKNSVSTSKEKKINTPNSVGEKNNEKEINTVVIKSWDENIPFEEKKPIRLREKANPNINNVNNNIIIENKEDIGNNNIKEKNDNNIILENKNEVLINNNINENNTNTNQKIEVMKNEKQNIENADNNDYNLEDIIYENLRLNKTFSEDKDQNILKFDIEYMCRCFSLSLLILIESSKENLHITEVILQDFSSPNLRFFFLNQNLNQNINLLFDMFDHEINKDLSLSKISPLDRLDSILSENEMSGNDDINALKHIKKETDEILIKDEEEKEKERAKNGKGTVKLRTGLGDIEKDIKFIDEFFSMNSKNKKKVINYQHVSEISKNVLCKELSYINEIDSELNGTNSNINNTNFNNSINNINDNSTRAKKVNTSNIIDNEEVKEENNNTSNNETNDLGITTENNDDKNENKNMSNNSMNLEEDINNKNNDINTNNKKEFDIDLNEENKIISPINNIDNYKKSNYENNDKLNDKIDINLNDNSNNIQITINNKVISSKIEKKDTDKAQKEEKEEKGKESKDQLEQKEPKNKEQSSINANTQNKEVSKENNEEDIYESDYIIDIKSVDELVYYFVKRSEIFDEDFNYLIMKIAERRYIPPPDPQTIFDFMADIIILTKMEREVIILSLIYIERLIFNTGILITSRNWRRILLTSMIISSRIWDDNSFENSHYSQVFANLGVSEINTLERIFLELINYFIYINFYLNINYLKYILKNNIFIILK